MSVTDELAANMEIAIPPLGDSVPGAPVDTIAAAARWLSVSDWNRSLKAPVDSLVTACVLARLAELPSAYLSDDLKSRVAESLVLLEQSHVPGSGWSRDGSNQGDAFTTAWAIIALRAQRRPVPRSAVNFLLACRQANGGFSAYPKAQEPDHNLSSAEVTVTVLRALNMCDRDAGDFLTSRLRNELSSTLAGKSSRFYLCSEILDWEGGLAPWPLLNLVSQSAVQFDLESAYDQALLLRILLRLRNQRAWLAAAALRKMQLPDGSWPVTALPQLYGPAQAGRDPLSSENARLISSVTSLTALVLNETQPGLYCHSDLLGVRRARD
jgi:hypothetical protein